MVNHIHVNGIDWNQAFSFTTAAQRRWLVLLQDNCCCTCVLGSLPLGYLGRCYPPVFCTAAARQSNSHNNLQVGFAINIPKQVEKPCGIARMQMKFQNMSNLISRSDWNVNQLWLLLIIRGTVTSWTRTLKSERALPRVCHYDSYFSGYDIELWPPNLKM